MRLATFIPPDDSRPHAGEVRGDTVIAYREHASMRDVLAHGALDPADGASFPLADVRLLAPVPDPVAVYGIGMNYRDHAAEIGAELPEAPVVFAKMSGSVTAPSGPVRCPPVIRRLDYEAELVVVMGAGGEIAGYAVADDITARDLQLREPQWVRGKGADTFCPWGPWITTADEVPDPHELAIRSWVNGELRQDSSTSQMLFRVPQLVEFLAETCTLRPGDLILTGTPGGVGMAMEPRRFLSDGDVVRVEVERLGAIEHPIESP